MDVKEALQTIADTCLKSLDTVGCENCPLYLKTLDMCVTGNNVLTPIDWDVGAITYVSKERLETHEIVHAMNVNKTYHEVDEFRCSNCGIHIENWDTWYPPTEVENEERYSEYAFKYCPNCGAKIDKGD